MKGLFNLSASPQLESFRGHFQEDLLSCHCKNGCNCSCLVKFYDMDIYQVRFFISNKHVVAIFPEQQLVVIDSVKSPE
jgi:hypothetical protein